MRKKLAAAAALLALAATAFAMPAAASLATVAVQAPKAELHLEVAQTWQEQERGLMGRTALAPHSGMLFVFPADQPVAFWMKNTLIPLDMVFVAADGTVRSVDGDVPTPAPGASDDAIPREPGRAKYVIELAAGEAARAGIVAGVRLRIPPLPRA